MPNTEASFAELKARLAKTIDYCKTFKPAQIDGTEDKDITIKLGANERKFTGQGLLQNFILPNFYFHCTTAYDILRHCGVELSKRDFMSTPVNLVRIKRGIDEVLEAHSAGLWRTFCSFRLSAAEQQRVESSAYFLAAHPG